MNLIVLLFEGIWIFLLPAIAAIVGFFLGKRYGPILRLKSRVVDLEGEIAQLKKQLEKRSESNTTFSPLKHENETKFLDKKPARAQRKSKFDALPGANLQIIEGIGPKMESVLKENNISNWQALSETSLDELRNILESYGKKYKIIDPASWSEQAKLAADGSWSQLVNMQKGLDGGLASQNELNTRAKVEKQMIKLGIIKEYKQDDLKGLEGIGPKIDELLAAEGIDTWEKLSMTEVSKLQAILDKAGKRFQLSDPTTWPKQAALASEGRFDELSDYQDILMGGR